MNRHLRDIQQGIDEIRATTPGAVHVLAEMQRALDAIKPRKPIAKRLPGVSRREAREARRKRHAEETAAIRQAVFHRACGRCEEIGCSREPTELHHLASGIGRRRQRQTVENCRAYCFECHRAAHRASKRAPGGGAT